MAPELSRLIRRVTFALVLLAALAIEVAIHDGRWMMGLGVTALWVAIAVGLGWFVPVPEIRAAGFIPAGKTAGINPALAAFRRFGCF